MLKIIFCRSRLIGFLRPMLSYSETFILSFHGTPEERLRLTRLGHVPTEFKRPRDEQHHQIVEGSSQKKKKNIILRKRKGCCAGKRQRSSDYKNRKGRRLM